MGLNNQVLFKGLGLEYSWKDDLLELLMAHEPGGFYYGWAQPCISKLCSLINKPYPNTDAERIKLVKYAYKLIGRKYQGERKDNFYDFVKTKINI